MSTSVTITDVRFVAANTADRDRGLLYFVSFTLGPFRFDGVTARWTRGGRYRLSFPIRHDREGRQWPIVRPINDAARQAIESEVFAALGVKLEERAP